MAKGEFRFKQFLIRQDQCAMKVCTDACVMGASISTSSKIEIKNILDIGSGTGILSLMLAQRYGAEIDAVEINNNAAKQSIDNIHESPWSSRIRVHIQSIQNFANHKSGKYDLIVSNPPFFENNLRTEDLNYNVACHSESLSYDEIIKIASTLLQPHGTFIAMFPLFESSVFKNKAFDFNLHNTFSTNIRHTENSPVIRKINYFQIGLANQFKEEEVIIRDKSGAYSETFQKLLAPYYTIF